MGYPMGLSLYAYTNQNPISYVDPDGQWVWFAVGAGASGLTYLATSESPSAWGFGAAVVGGLFGGGASTLVGGSAAVGVGAKVVYGALSGATGSAVGGQVASVVETGELKSVGATATDAMVGAFLGVAFKGVAAAYSKFTGGAGSAKAASAPQLPEGSPAPNTTPNIIPPSAQPIALPQVPPFSNAQRGAEWLADSVQGMSKSTRPGVTAAQDFGGRVYGGASGQTARTGNPIDSTVQGWYDSVPAAIRSRFHGRCAEPLCLSNAVKAGETAATMQGGTSVAVSSFPDALKQWKAPCSSCEYVLNMLGILH
jgi:hypothetical protein